MFEFLKIGGIYFMAVITIMWVVVILFSVKFLLNYYSSNRDVKKLAKQNSLIMFIGSFAFLFGLLGQTLGIYSALKAVQAAGDISPALIAGGLRVSLIAPLYGFILFLISGIAWFIFRNLIRE